MDSAISTAARALALGDALGALKLVALRADPPALALRGIALAQLGELKPARQLLRRAAAAFGDAEPVARARCVVAEAEVALALRDLRGAPRELESAGKLLARRSDFANAAMAVLVQARQQLLLGRVEAAAKAVARLSLTQAPPRFAALGALVETDIAVKQLQSRAAEQALERAAHAAQSARIPALEREIERARTLLTAPVARLRSAGRESVLRLAELERLFASPRLLVDAGRRELRQGARTLSLVTRPILLELLVALAARAPAEVLREQLIADVFGARRSNESHRARLRVEIGRLRKLVVPFAALAATPGGFALQPLAGPIATLLPPSPDEASALLSLLRGGDAWATSALAASLGKSQRSVQRALSELEAAGKVRAAGAARARRWVATPSPAIATTMLLGASTTLG